MREVDGQIVIGTKVDDSGVDRGLKSVKNKVNRTVSGIGNSIGKMVSSAIGLLASIGFAKMGKEALDLASDIAEVQNVVDVSFGDMKYKIEDFAKTCIDNFGMSELSAKQMASTMMAMGSAMGQARDIGSDYAVELTARLGDVASFYNKSLKEVETLGRAVYSGETESLKQIGVLMTQDNLAQFALEKGYKKTYKAMSAQEKLLIRQEYFLSATNLAAGDFVRTQDSWANQTKILSERWKQFLSVLGGQGIAILSKVLVYVNKLVSVMTDFARKMSAVLQNVFGLDIKGAEEAFEGMSSGMDSSSESAEELSKNITKLNEKIGVYDDLNVITQDTGVDFDSVSAPTEDLTDSLKEATSFDTTETIIDGWIKNIGESIKQGDWASAGSILADKLKKSFATIDFRDIGDKIGSALRNAISFGASLLSGEWLNTAFEGVGTTIGRVISNTLGNVATMSIVGTSAANMLNSIVDLVKGFAFNTDWSNVGAGISASIQSFFATFDLGDVATTISGLIQGLLTTIGSLFTSMNWGELVSDLIQGLIDFFANLDLSGIVITLIDVIMSIIDSVVQIVQSIFANKEKLQELIDTVLNMIVDLISALAESLPTLIETLLDAALSIMMTFFSNPDVVVNLVKSLIGAIIQIVGKLAESLGEVIVVLVNSIVDMIVEFFKDPSKILDFVAAILEIIGTVVIGILQAIGSVINGLCEGIVDAIWGDGTWDTFKQDFVNFWKNIWKNIKSVFKNVGTFFKNAFDGAVKNVKNAFSGIKTFFTGIWNKIKAVFANVGTFFKNAFNGAVKKIKSAFEGIKTFFSSVWTSIKSVFSKVGNWFGTKFSQAYDNIGNAFSSIGQWASGVWESITEVFSGVGQWFYNIFNSAVTKIKFVFSQIGDFFSGIWDKITDGLKSFINGFLGFFGGFVNKIIDGINFLIDKINTVSFDVPDWVPGIGGTTFGFAIPNVAKWEVPRLATGAVIPPNRQFLAMLGDQKHGTNIETPLDTMIEAFNTALENNGGFSGEIKLYLSETDSEPILKWLRNEERKYNKRYGLA